MKNGLIRTLVALTIAALGTAANAGVISSGVDISLPRETVAYQSFSIGIDTDVTFEAELDNFGTDSNADTINFFLLEGTFGSFGSVVDRGPLTDFTDFMPSITDTISLLAGTYTYAIGTNRLTEAEARSGVASTPDIDGLTYSFSISAADVPAPAPLALLLIGVAGLVASRRTSSPA